MLIHADISYWAVLLGAGIGAFLSGKKKNKPEPEPAPSADDENWRQRLLIQSEVQKSLGDIVSGFAHEINNPLTGIFGALDLLLLRDKVPAEIKDKLIQIQQQAKRIKSVIEKLHQLSPDSVHTKHEIDLANLLDKLIKVVGSTRENAEIAFVRDFSDAPLVVYGNHFSLWQAFDNVIGNAVEAILDREVAGGRIHVQLGRTPDGQYAIVEITDNGGGFTDISKVFDPFYTTKSRSRNKGIGLNIVFNIVKEHMGSILVSNNDQGGATVTVYLPNMANFKPDTLASGG